MVKLIFCNYGIVNKKECRVLLRTLKECKIIYKAYQVLSEDSKKELKSILNEEITTKIDKCFDYYNKNYSVEIENGYNENDNIDINMSNICEKIKSWEC